MGKIRTRILGLEEVERKQKEEQKQRAQEKKQEKRKVRAPGLKGGERMVELTVKEEDLAKMEEAKKILTEKKEVKKPEVKRIRKKRARGQKYQKAKSLVDKKKTYKLEEAIKLLKQIKYTEFDESVELHLNVDKVGLKGEVSLPYSTGKSVKVAVVNEKVLGQIEEGKIDFDVLVTHPSFMPRLIKLAKILGPKGLMPNPKTGTISENPDEVVKKFQKGVLRWKTEPKFPLIHQMIGKISFEEKQISENVVAFIKSVGVKHIKSAFIKTTMSPALKIELSSTAY